MAPANPDWIGAAASEIRESTGDLANSEIREIISRHCPLAPDVAYMPVPRCDTCAHWTLRPEYVEPHGACTAEEIGSDCNDYTIIVPADFGCVQWKSKK